MKFLSGVKVLAHQVQDRDMQVPTSYRRLGNFNLLSYIFVARAHRRNLNVPKINLRDNPVELHMRYA